MLKDKHIALKVIVVVALMMLTIYYIPSVVYAQEKKNDPAQITEQRVLSELGIQGTFIKSFGNVSSYMPYGYGCALHYDVSSYEYTFFNLRIGVSSEFGYFNAQRSSMSATLMLLPEYAYLMFAFQLGYGFRFDIKTGAGVTIAMLKKKEYKTTNINKTSYDLTIATGVGLSFNPPKVSHLIIFVEADYLLMFEKVKGHFVAPSVGVSYKF